jgi:predicted DNA-binding transcriptional regulator YafY
MPHNLELLSKLPKAQIDRLTFIDFRLYFLGELRRADLVERFATGAAGATRDIAMYREVAPENCEFDGTSKVYRPSMSFTPAFEHPVTRALTALSQGFGEVAAQRTGPLVRCDFPAPLSLPRVDVLATITRAIHRGVAVRVAYSSNTSGTNERQLVPFALVNNGLRWHARAYDRKTKSFRDFVLTRMSKTVLLDDDFARPEEMPENDVQWSRIIELELMVHPLAERPEVIAKDYDMVEGIMKVRVRATNAGYLLQLWNIDCSPGHNLKGKQYVLALRDPLLLHSAESALMAPGYVDLRPKT